MRIFKSGRMSMFFIVNAVSACIYVNKGGPCKWKHKKCFAHKIKTVVGRTHKKKKKADYLPVLSFLEVQKHTHI